MYNIEEDQKLGWFDDVDIRPYVYVRANNQIDQPGSRHPCSWFSPSPVHLDPLHIDNLEFANQILEMEHKAFAASEMPMDRWVFYDCAIMPGFVTGFACRNKALSAAVRQVVGSKCDLEWIPISLFIIIPAVEPGEWVAHNLSSVNPLLPREERYYGLGFLTKAFGLWYANIETSCGMTQWKSPAIRLHSHYGPFEILTSFTPVHSYSHTLTYRSCVDVNYWSLFFNKQGVDDFDQKYDPSGMTVDPNDEKSLIYLQRQLEAGGGPYFLRPGEIRTQPLDSVLNVYQPKA